jgi:hypothetical protein
VSYLLLHTSVLCATFVETLATSNRSSRRTAARSPARSSSPAAGDANLVVADVYQHSPLVLGPTLSQQSARKLQTVSSGALDWSIEAVGQPLDVHAASSL